MQPFKSQTKVGSLKQEATAKGTSSSIGTPKLLYLKKLTLSDACTSKQIKLPRAAAEEFIMPLQDRECSMLDIVDELGRHWSFSCTRYNCQYALSKIGGFAQAHQLAPEDYMIFLLDEQGILRVACRRSLPSTVLGGFMVLDPSTAGPDQDHIASSRMAAPRQRQGHVKGIKPKDPPRDDTIRVLKDVSNIVQRTSAPDLFQGPALSLGYKAQRSVERDLGTFTGQQISGKKSEEPRGDLRRVGGQIVQRERQISGKENEEPKGDPLRVSGGLQKCSQWQETPRPQVVQRERPSGLATATNAPRSSLTQTDCSAQQKSRLSGQDYHQNLSLLNPATQLLAGISPLLAATAAPTRPLQAALTATCTTPYAGQLSSMPLGSGNDSGAKARWCLSEPHMRPGSQSAVGLNPSVQSQSHLCSFNPERDARNSVLLPTSDGGAISKHVHGSPALPQISSTDSEDAGVAAAEVLTLLKAAGRTPAGRNVPLNPGSEMWPQKRSLLLGAPGEGQHEVGSGQPRSKMTRTGFSDQSLKDSINLQPLSRQLQQRKVRSGPSSSNLVPQLGHSNDVASIGDGQWPLAPSGLQTPRGPSIQGQISPRLGGGLLQPLDPLLRSFFPSGFSPLQFGMGAQYSAHQHSPYGGISPANRHLPGSVLFPQSNEYLAWQQLLYQNAMRHHSQSMMGQGSDVPHSTAAAAWQPTNLAATLDQTGPLPTFPYGSLAPNSTPLLSLLQQLGRDLSDPIICCKALAQEDLLPSAPLQLLSSILINQGVVAEGDTKKDLVVQDESGSRWQCTLEGECGIGAKGCYGLLGLAGLLSNQGAVAGDILRLGAGAEDGSHGNDDGTSPAWVYSVRLLRKADVERVTAALAQVMP